MSKKIRKILKIFLFVILIGVFAVSISVGVFTVYHPQAVIDRLQPLVPSVTPVPLKMKGIAVLGDSQSDEYRADDNRGDNYPSATKNWVELLAKVRGTDFGEWGDWGEPRRTGFEYNWARSGATARSLIESGQHTGVAQQVKEGKLNVVILFIGALDFAPYITQDDYGAIYNNNLSDPDKKSKINRVIADIKTAVYAIKDAGEVRILLVKIPDWGNHLGVQVAYPFPDQRAQVSEVVKDANAEIDKLAQEENLQTVDPNELYNDLFYKNGSAKITVDGVPLERLLLNNNPRNFYLSDGVHTGTVINGFLANTILDKLNTMISNRILPFSEIEIRQAAGL